MPGKALLTSWEFWANVLLGTAQTVDALSGAGVIPQPYGIIIQSVASILIRAFRTSQPITSILPQ